MCTGVVALSMNPKTIKRERNLSEFELNQRKLKNQNFKFFQLERMIFFYLNIRYLLIIKGTPGFLTPPHFLSLLSLNSTARWISNLKLLLPANSTTLLPIFSRSCCETSTNWSASSTWRCSRLLRPLFDLRLCPNIWALPTILLQQFPCRWFDYLTEIIGLIMGFYGGWLNRRPWSCYFLNLSNVDFSTFLVKLLPNLLFHYYSKIVFLNGVNGHSSSREICRWGGFLEK